LGKVDGDKIDRQSFSGGAIKNPKFINPLQVATL